MNLRGWNIKPNDNNSKFSTRKTNAVDTNIRFVERIFGIFFTVQVQCQTDIWHHGQNFISLDQVSWKRKA